MSVSAPSIYNEALFGEPVDVPVFSPTVRTGRDFWTVGEWGIDLPAPVVHRAPDVQRMIRELRQWTQWSSRQLANLLRTSHTTVLSAEAGRPLMQSRTGDLRRRVGAAHDVVERVFLLAGRDPAATARILGESSAVDALRNGNPERAYLSAIDVIRPRETGLLVGARPRRDGATAALHD